MLKKFVSSLLAVVMLCGCAAKTDTGSDAATADSMASSLISKLKLSSSLSATKDRIIKGMVFNGEDIVSDSALYTSSETGNSDSVGVFYAKDLDTCKQDVNAYLDTQKANAQTYNADQVFKISNAVVEDNGSIVVMVVCDDIESAKKAVKEALK
ncbi:MAG: DUF4358 domain-containing protein [Solobacterium sp.]|jgi:hypothetical protein|nr:DUF4358 domain-containing protein [Solobacterium sp.]MCH4205667.1 DUF4358 domain-containing protein [Solobacterium sp.]MCH4227140.1 DUF4358 domain-containing protein [Solobacterium sp.]MCH4282497.1 DUF4358 domain-containing protein [Solobacterium sp.]